MSSYPHSSGPQEIRPPANTSEPTGPQGAPPRATAEVLDTAPDAAAGGGPPPAPGTPSMPTVAPGPAGTPPPGVAPPGQWHFTAPRPSLWHNRTLRVSALFSLLALCGMVILALVREQTGAEGFVVGLTLAVLPVPFLLGIFVWLDRVTPTPWRILVFAFTWGACAATLIAILANSLATELLATAMTETPAETDALGATFVAPLVEETAKGAALLLLFLFFRRHFQGVVDGVVFSGITATGFAFTENILYLGSAFGEDQAYGVPLFQSSTIGTFFVRVIMTPFAHPLFTCMTGIGFALAATAGPGRRWRRRLAPLTGLLASMVLHGVWNGTATLSPWAFFGTYAVLMLPVLGCLVWAALRSRANTLHTIRTQLPVYTAAGWIGAPESVALSSMRARNLSRLFARRTGTEPAVREYQADATALAFLRGRAARGTAGPDFTAREEELLHRLWKLGDIVRPALAQAAYTVRPPYFPHPYHQPYGFPPQSRGPYAHRPHPAPGFPPPYGNPYTYPPAPGGDANPYRTPPPGGRADTH